MLRWTARASPPTTWPCSVSSWCGIPCHLPKCRLPAYAANSSQRSSPSLLSAPLCCLSYVLVHRQSPGETNRFFTKIQRTANNASETVTFNPYTVLPRDRSYWCAHLT
jgi:hypothetical protein